jgi:signal transduction histidine kinase
MAQPARDSYFAPPERSELQEIAAVHASLAADDELCLLLNIIPEFVMLVNRSRQILLGNRALRDFAAARGCDDFIGLRPGELLACQHALTAPSGCGTGEACRTCGAVESILAALSGNQAENECRILRKTPEGIEALDLKVWGTPYRRHGEDLAIVVAVDISNEKRRKVLERIFFHDILNTAGVISSLTELLMEGVVPFEEAKDTLFQTAHALVSEIRAQRELLAAENNELTVKETPIHSRLLLESVISTYRNTLLGKKSPIVLGPDLCEVIFYADERLLTRVLGNLLKNALEASDDGSTVTLGCRADREELLLWCNNGGVIPPETQLQIFNRSFSTKEPGRGIGTYSVKLLTERYLKGRVSFISTMEEGTTFTITLPAAQRVSE